ncbi:NERD domain-containing protein [Paenibacillus sp. FSL K6-1122]|uniref:NERD domain-containing protein n=1 Tax=Paenibacillus sp. FSL K6-1122 TaxID=2954512 RepID=UPI0030EF56B4
MIPDLTEIQLSQVVSQGEVQVYRELKSQLPDSFIVFSQVAWILKEENDKARDGETDFVICHPSKGYLCVEVKGGGISFDSITNQWYSIDRYSQKNLIKDPIQQSKNAKYSIRKKLYENEEWIKSGYQKVSSGHAVFFPDLRNPLQLGRADMPTNLIGTLDNMTSIKQWIENCFEWWGKENASTISLGTRGVEVFRKIFANSVSVKVLVSTSLEKNEEIRIKLTNEQIKVLDLLRRQRRVVVSGGAGTGKTILAVEKAKRLANEGFSTLLTCYNRPLADHLSEICRDTERLDVMDFHQLCYKKIKEADGISKRNLLSEAKTTFPGEDEYDVQLPNALVYSLDIILDRYDAIVCDEGQDFREEYWLPLELMLCNQNSSPFYIFYDDNQNLYSRVSTFPISDEGIYSLTKNCRNTIPIHTASYQYYQGDSVEHSNIEGQEIQFEQGNNTNKQAIKIHTKILNLILEEKVNPKNITVLIGDAKYKQIYFDALKEHPLPQSIQYLENDLLKENVVSMTSINRFKGLESEIVFLWGMDYLDFNEYRELIYVGLSRAKSMLFIVGNEETCIKFQLIN